jgi:LETM1 and EF-hand domain-containing protein 1
LHVFASNRQQLDLVRLRISVYPPPPRHNSRALSSPAEKGSVADTAASNLANRSWLKQKWEVIKHEAHHYWVGTKLLGTEIMICVRILRQVSAAFPSA